MAITIFTIYIRIIIAEVLVTGVIRRIDIDDINFTCMSVSESGKCFEVVALD